MYGKPERPPETTNEMGNGKPVERLHAPDLSRKDSGRSEVPREVRTRGNTSDARDGS